MKKTLITVLVIIMVTIAGYFVMRIFFPGSSAPVVDKINEFLPFGTGEGINIPTNGSDGSDDSQFGGSGSSTSQTNLFQVTSVPVAGAVLLTKDKQTFVRYVDRATGHIYDVDLSTLKETQITNETLPKIYEAYFKSDGNTALIRALKDDSDTIDNISLNLSEPKNATTSDTLYTITASMLKGNMSDVAVSSAGNLFYVLKDSGSIMSSGFDGSNPKTIFSSPFTDWRLMPAGKDLIIYTKASANLPGYAYTMTSKSALVRALGPLNALTINPDQSGVFLLYSYTDSEVTKLFSKNLKAGTSVEIVPATLAEKCVWSTKNLGTIYCGVPKNGIGRNEPDNWYKGVTHFSDNIISTKVESDISDILTRTDDDLNTQIDVSNPQLSPSEDYLIFINRNDLSLWALKLE